MDYVSPTVFFFFRGASQVKQKFQLDEKRKEVNKVQSQITEKKKASKGQDKCWESQQFLSGGGSFSNVFFFWLGGEVLFTKKLVFLLHFFSKQQ